MGVSIWLDDLSRQRLVTGSLAGLVAHDHVVGVTTNPTIFAKALRALTAFDVRWACDVLRPVWSVWTAYVWWIGLPAPGRPS